MSAQETAVLIAFDAMRICLGLKPRNFTRTQVQRWMKLMETPDNGNG